MTRPLLDLFTHVDGKDPTTRRRRGRRVCSVVAATAAALSGAAAVPASGTETNGGVAAGRNITVFHNIDFVAVSGWTVNEPISVSIVRNGVMIGSVSAPAVVTPEGVGLEVNHGPEGAPAPGDCWDGTTPNIRPGDVILVSNGVETDEVTVDDIHFVGEPAVDPATGDVVVSAVARHFDGTPFTVAELDSPEFRSPNFDLRAEAAEIGVTATDPANGVFEVRYEAPFAFSRNRDNLTPAQIRNELLGDGHAIGFGHTEPPPGDAQVVEGLGDNPGPAAGCEGSPSAQHTVTSVAPAVVNAGNAGADLEVGGVTQNATEVTVALTDGTTTEEVTATLGAAAADGIQTWTATFPAASVSALGDGDLTLAGTYTTPTGPVTGTEKTLLKDTVSPTAPVASLGTGEYLGAQSVTLSAGPDEEIRYTLGNGSQPAPTANSGTRYRGGAIRITSSQTLKMIVVDRAGNVSPVVSESFAIEDAVTPAAPRIRHATAGRGRATVRWSRPAGNGGPAVTGYRVRVYERGRLVRTVLAGRHRTQRTVRGLDRGRPHRFRVQARNSVGFGPVSARSNRVVPRGVPSRPRIRRAFSGHRGGRDTAVARWRRPRTNNGARVTGYRVRALPLRRNGTVIWRQTRTTPMLRPGDRRQPMRLRAGRYRFQVRAYNSVGRSRWSPRSNRVRSR